MKLVFATNNAHKLEEIRKIIEPHFQILSLSDIGCTTDIPETGTTLQENALIKATYVKEHFGYDCFADDTGLEVDALDGAPGVYSARYAGEQCNSDDNIDKLLHALQHQENRRAQFTTVIALLRNNQHFFFEGRVEGLITRERFGINGFGYDPVFQPKGFEKTFAELSASEKNKISHRALAVKKLIDYLTETIHNYNQNEKI